MIIEIIFLIIPLFIPYVFFRQRITNNLLILSFNECIHKIPKNSASDAKKLCVIWQLFKEGNCPCKLMETPSTIFERNNFENTNSISNLSRINIIYFFWRYIFRSRTYSFSICYSFFSYINLIFFFKTYSFFSLQLHIFTRTYPFQLWWNFWTTPSMHTPSFYPLLWIWI